VKRDSVVRKYRTTAADGGIRCMFNNAYDVEIVDYH